MRIHRIVSDDTVVALMDDGRWRLVVLRQVPARGVHPALEVLLEGTDPWAKEFETSEEAESYARGEA